MKFPSVRSEEGKVTEKILERASTDPVSTAISKNGSVSQLSKEVFVKCVRCRALLYTREWQRNYRCCPHCGYHFRLSAPDRIECLLDPGSFQEIDTQYRSSDPLQFKSQSRSYVEKLTEEQARTGLYEAVVSGTGSIEGYKIVLAVMDFHFIGGSMGSVVGEKITRAIELAQEKRLPLFVISASGGARMQEGIFSLMQMAKTTVALTHLSQAGVPFISLLTDPTTGGVLASFAMQGDIILAEPEACIGFAGPRVIEQFSHQSLPEETDTSEFMLAHGMIDAIVTRPMLRSVLAQLLQFYATQGKHRQQALPIHVARAATQSRTPDSMKPASLRSSEGEHAAAEDGLQWSPWEKVQLARHKDRPHTADYIRLMCSNAFELHGDRRYADDAAVMGALALFADQTVMIIGHQKGYDSRERQTCNFGMPHPEGYRKAQRLMLHAEKFGFPIIFLIDTPGAFPGLEAEERGQAQAIAESLSVMATLRVPIISVIIGEGGSGGALAFGLADRMLMLENSIYTVASPEAAASILWRDNAKAIDAAQAMRITAHDLLSLGVIDSIIPEPKGGAQLDYTMMNVSLTTHLYAAITELQAIPIVELMAQRYTKFRSFGRFSRIV